MKSMNVLSLSPQSVRLTRHRQAVLATIAAHPIHRTAAEVYAAMQSTQPHIAFATVYNALHYLVQARLIAEVRRPDGVIAYDRNTAPHDHIICRRCGRLDDVAPLAQPWPGGVPYAGVTAHTGYLVEGHRVEYVGLCPQCRATPALP
jgi:Fe2+ or Zn2+ uptake regulation protein